MKIKIAKEIVKEELELKDGTYFYEICNYLDKPTIFYKIEIKDNWVRSIELITYSEDCMTYKIDKQYKQLPYYLNEYFCGARKGEETDERNFRKNLEYYGIE